MQPRVGMRSYKICSLTFEFPIQELINQVQRNISAWFSLEVCHSVPNDVVPLCLW